MSGVSITGLDPASTLTGSEIVPVVQSGTTVRTTLAAITSSAISTTVASLPSASTAGIGARKFVTDATATTFASTVAGGGANKVPVYSDGTNWKIG